MNSLIGWLHRERWWEKSKEDVIEWAIENPSRVDDLVILAAGAQIALTGKLASPDIPLKYRWGDNPQFTIRVKYRFEIENPLEPFEKMKYSDEWVVKFEMKYEF